MRSRSFYLLALLIVGFLSACTYLLNRPTPPSNSKIEIPAEETLTDATLGQCAYVWASEPLPDLSEELQAMAHEVGLKEVRVRAEAFGEKCITSEGSSGPLLIKQTDVRFAVRVVSIRDPDEMSQQVKEIIRFLAGFSAEKFPGPVPGNIAIGFQDDHGDVFNLWFNNELAQEALRQELEGEAFLEALKFP